MTTNLDQVKDTIRKLLNLANNDAAAEGEIDNALRFASRLMAAHHLSEDDVATDPHEAAADLEMATESAETHGRHVASWEATLGIFVEKFVGSIGCFRGSPMARLTEAGTIKYAKNGRMAMVGQMVFYGPKEEAALATELYKMLSQTVAAMARLKYGGAFRGSGRAYGDGFVDGLFTKLESAKKQDVTSSSDCRALSLRCTSLVEAKKAAATKWLREEKGIRLRAESRTSNWDPAAQADGLADGKKADVSLNRTGRLQGEGTLLLK